MINHSLQTTDDEIHVPNTAEVVAGKIVLRTSYVHLFRCRRIPDGWWDPVRRVWLYPATARHANFIRETFPELEAADDFTRLVEANGKRKIVVPPALPELPSGLKTQPWRHQIDAYQFAMDRLLHGTGAAMLALEMGTGKTLVSLMVLAG